MKKLLKKIFANGSMLYKIIFWIVVAGIIIRLIVAGIAVLHLNDAGAIRIFVQMVIGLIINTVAAVALSRVAWPPDSYKIYKI